MEMEKTFKVGYKYRTSYLSKRSGGSVVCVKKTTGPIYEYNNVKFPEPYIKTLLEDPEVVEAWVKKN